MDYEQLNQIKEKALKEVNFRRYGDTSGVDYKYDITICGETGCKSCKSQKVYDKLNEVIKSKGLENTIKVHTVGCFGLCAYGPIVIVYPQNTLYQKVMENDCEEIVSALETETIVERLLPKNSNNEPIFNKNDLPFCEKQKYIVRKNTSFASLENMIEDYIALDGYAGIYKVLTSMTPEDVIKVIKDSGLRGRGGAGFPTGNKWEFTRVVEAPQKYVICNADEGDPGAYMDRSVIESNPHAIIEAMMICGYAIGASKGFVYLRAEYPLAGERLQNAIDDANTVTASANVMILLTFIFLHSLYFFVFGTHIPSKTI